MPTITDVEEAWKQFDDIKEHAEQHDFPRLLYCDLKLSPLYDDLHQNWDEHHAEVFMKAMTIMLRPFGYKVNMA